jgi:hypothetical protein
MGSQVHAGDDPLCLCSPIHKDVTVGQPLVSPASDPCNPLALIQQHCLSYAQAQGKQGAYTTDFEVAN